MLRITKEIKDQMLSAFPSIELSYEKVLHKKVPADLYMLVPKGYKVFVWLTQWQAKKICLVVSYHKETKIYHYSVDFSDECAMTGIGTIMYGTLFDYQGMKHFTCEDIFYYKGQPNTYKGQPISKNKNNKSLLAEKFEVYKEIFATIRSTTKENNAPLPLKIGLPLMCHTLEDAFQKSNELPYEIYSIQIHSSQIHRNLTEHHKIGAYLIKNGMPFALSETLEDKNPMSKPNVAYSIKNSINNSINNSSNINNSIKNKQIVLKVRANIGDDMYYLYCSDDTEETKEKCLGLAMISTYKSSVMMNTIFRRIRENSNLDLLEESDDEDDFEDRTENKYVDLDKTVLMNCVYAKRFKKWQPISIFQGNGDSALSSYSEIKKREY